MSFSDSNYLSNKPVVDYYNVNNDYSGQRNMRGDSETVQFRNNSSMRIFYNQEQIGYDTHWHNSIEIICPIQGSYDVAVGGTDFHLLPKEILFVPPRELHSIYKPDQGQRFIFLFDLSMLNGIKGFSGIQALLAQPLHVTKDTYHDIYDEVYDILMEIKNEYFRENEYAELSIIALLINCFVKFGYNHLHSNNLFPNVRQHKQKEYVEKFNSIMTYIDSHYSENLSLEAIASAAGFSKYHFSRLFKQYTNYTFCDYVCYRRLKVAEELLSRSNLSVTEISLQAGFPSISTFNRLFKQYVNCTPSEYRSKKSGKRQEEANSVDDDVFPINY